MGNWERGGDLPAPRIEAAAQFLPLTGIWARLGFPPNAVQCGIGTSTCIRACHMFLLP